MSNTILTLLSTAQLDAFSAAGYWHDRTVYSLTRAHAEQTPDKVAIRERVRDVTYRALIDAADRLAGALHRRGVRQGQRVAVWLPGRIETAAAVLACSRNGYVCCPSLHRDHTVGEVAELLARMRASALIAEEGYGADADRRDVFMAAEGVESLRLHVRLTSDAMEDDAAPIFADLPATAGGELRTDPNTVVYLAFTSGTTGRPKGVMHSDNTLLAPVRALAADWSLTDDMVIYSLSPLSHNLGFGAMLLALTGGGQLVIHDLPRGASVAERLVETRATFLFGVPTHAIDLLAELEADTGRQLPHVRGFRVSGAAMPPVVAQGLLNHGIVPQSGYGMTEAGSTHYTRPDDDRRLIVDSAGRAFDGHEARIFSREDPDEELPTGEIGQIGGRGPSLMLGYFDDQATTESSFNASGWFLSGDLGWMDEAGYVRITGRKKDLIIRGGHNIFPAKIENLAMRHAAVERAAVIPVPDARLGEKVCLAVTLKPGHTATAEELLDHLDAEGLSKYDMPEYFVELDTLPLMPSGKILKRDLVAWLNEEKVQPSPVRFRPKTGT